MLKTKWTYLALGVLVAAGGGGTYYYTTRLTVEELIPESAAAPAALAPSVPRDEDVDRKVLEGIGSIKQLRPVPLRPALQR
jgi:hypothetical protein